MPLRLNLIRIVRVEESRNLPLQLLGQTSRSARWARPDDQTYSEAEQGDMICGDSLWGGIWFPC